MIRALLRATFHAQTTLFVHHSQPRYDTLSGTSLGSIALYQRPIGVPFAILAAIATAQYMLRCYDSDTQNQEGESSLHAHFACKPDCSTTFRHEEKHLHGCCARNGAQKISDSFKTAEDRLEPARQRGKPFASTKISITR